MLIFDAYPRMLVLMVNDMTFTFVEAGSQWVGNWVKIYT